MRKIVVLLLFLVFILQACSEPVADADKLQIRNSIYYLPNESEPYTGVAKSYYASNGQIKVLVKVINGRFDGAYNSWHENGQKWSESTYKNGELDGVLTSWYSDGQKNFEMTFKNGKKKGLITEWYENGQKKTEGTYNNGGKDGLFTSWYENGQKSSESTYKDGELQSERKY